MSLLFVPVNVAILITYPLKLSEDEFSAIPLTVNKLLDGLALVNLRYIYFI